MRCVVSLALYNLKRLARHRGALIALYALPLVVALLKAAFAKSQAVLVSAWVCPFACALMIWAILYSRAALDRAIGLDNGFRGTLISDSGILWARIISGAIVFVGQMAVFAGIILTAH
ncbi:MAG: hypothetical protein ABFD49_08140 [Armatimonadota bacterium]|nr:hypothetical protein [bacterium]